MIKKAFVAVLMLSLIGVLAAPSRAQAASAVEIDADVGATVERFTYQVSGARDLLRRAAGVLVFPSIVKAGFVAGGEYGEGAAHRRAHGWVFQFDFGVGRISARRAGAVGRHRVHDG